MYKINKLVKIFIIQFLTHKKTFPTISSSGYLTFFTYIYRYIKTAMMIAFCAWSHELSAHELYHRK